MRKRNGTEEDDARALLSLCQQLATDEDFSPRKSPCSSPRSSRTFGCSPSAFHEDVEHKNDGDDDVNLGIALNVAAENAVTEADRRRARERLEEQFRSSSRSGAFEQQGSSGDELSSDLGRWRQQVAKIEAKAFFSAAGEPAYYHLLLDQLSFIAIADHCSPTTDVEDHEDDSSGGQQQRSSPSFGGPLRPRSSSAVQCGTSPPHFTATGPSSTATRGTGALTVAKTKHTKALGAGLASRAGDTPHRAPKRRKVGEGDRRRSPPRATSVPWTDADDDLLKKYVQSIGTKWTMIGGKLKRTGKQCRERWCNHVDPQVSHEPWTEAEDTLLLQAHLELGNQWVEIAKRLPGRPYNAVKNRFNKASLRSKFKPAVAAAEAAAQEQAARFS